MGLFTGLGTGIALTKDSLALIRHNPELLVFPLVGGTAGLTFLGVFLGLSFQVIEPESMGAITAYAGLFGIYLGLTFISSFFSAGLVHETREAFAGREPSLRSGLAAAWDERWPILTWSIIAATVGFIIHLLESSDSRMVKVMAFMFSAAWTVLTFFVIPVIVFERVSVREMFSRSKDTFKQTWGETAISLIGVQVAAALIAVPVLALGAFIAISEQMLLGVAVLLVGALLAFLLAQTLQGVVKTALYFYATEGTKPDEFGDVDFDRLAGDDDSRRTPTQRQTGGRF